jgi:two-component system sensor kinase FixL
MDSDKPDLALQHLVEELRDRETRLNAVLETAVDGIVTIDEQGVIESVNPATERMFGYEAAELTGAKVQMLMPEPYRSSHDDYVATYLQTGEARIIGAGREAEALRKDGSVFPIDLSISEIQIGGRRLFTGMIRDITARKSAEAQAQRRLEELAHASRLSEMGEMTSGIAHEINQPLAAIVSFATACLRMVDAGTARPEVLRGALQSIAEQAQRAGDIVHHLRQLARKGESDKAPVDLNATLRGVLELVRHDLGTRGVELDSDLDDTLPPVLANRTQIEQVALNLVRNAVDAMAECPPCQRILGLRTRASGPGLVEVVVADSGIGLTEEVRERLFQTFFTTKATGVGVGLSISRSLVESHGGRLWAASMSRDGAAFHFTLPVAVRDSTPPVAVRDSTPPVAVRDSTPPVAVRDSTPPVAVRDQPSDRRSD